MIVLPFHFSVFLIFIYISIVVNTIDRSFQNQSQDVLVVMCSDTGRYEPILLYLPFINVGQVAIKLTC